MPDPPKWGWNDDHPMVMVTWQDAVDYGRWAFGDDQKIFLPTEAEYERAMQGPDESLFPWGNVWDPQGAINSIRPNRFTSTQPVGIRAQNAFALFDIAGNVWEWCVDWYDPKYYKTAPASDPTGPDKETSSRVIRGGGWDVTNQKFFRSDFRGKAIPTDRFHNTGFRCAAG